VIRGVRACVAALLCALAGCATLPEGAVERALYADLRKAVELSEDTGWVVDRIQAEENLEAVMRSVCQVDAAARANLDAWLGSQLQLHGGSAEAQYLAHDRDLDAAEGALTLERTRTLLRAGIEHAASDCPFWLPPDPDFAGVEGDADRIVILLESIGFGAVIIQGSETALGGGGGGRVLLGHGLGARVTLAAGAEIGGRGAFIGNREGTRRIETTFVAAMPLLLRLTSFSRVMDFELAPVMRIDVGQSVFPLGVRANIGYGIPTMRSAALMPYGVLWLGYEGRPPANGEAAEHSIRIGTRVGVDWDP
jgi:hypothetical protein